MVSGTTDVNAIEFNTTGLRDAMIYSKHDGTTASNKHIAFYLNGCVERMRINYLGNLGVGVTDPLYKIHSSGDINISSGGVYRIGGTQVLSSFALSVTGNVSGGSLSITGDVTIDTNTFKVDSSNNWVGIGTATPAYILDVQTTNNSTGFARFLNSVPAPTFINWTAPTGISLFRMNSENYIRMVSGTTDVNAIEFNTTGLRDAMIYSKHDGTTASNKHIAFYLNGCVERVRIDYLGRLGVGITNPQYQIHSSSDINISSGVYRIGGTQVLSSSALSVTGNVSGATLTGTLQTPTQPNVTSLGVLSSLSVSGTLTSSGIVQFNNSVGVGVSPTAPLHVQISSTSGDPDTRGIYCYNSNSGNTSAHSSICARTNTSGGGSPYLSLDVNGVAGWSIACDNSDSRKLKISPSWNGWSSPAISIDTSKNTTLSGQLSCGVINRSSYNSGETIKTLVYSFRCGNSNLTATSAGNGPTKIFSLTYTTSSYSSYLLCNFWVDYSISGSMADEFVSQMKTSTGTIMGASRQNYTTGTGESMRNGVLFPLNGSLAPNTGISYTIEIWIQATTDDTITFVNSTHGFSIQEIKT
jgi:hypothetical protein